MRPPWIVFVVSASLGLAGCAGSRAGARPQPCQLEFLFKGPARPFDRLGDLQDIVRTIPPGGAWEALRPAACALGADAVVVEQSTVLNVYEHTLVVGYAIRWRPQPPSAPPAPPAPPAELPEAPPPELKPTP